MIAVAPAAPGKLGDQPDPQRLLTYLTDLGLWLTSRRAELDELDAAVQASDHAGELTGDVRLGLTLWQAIKTRNEQLLATWDSGRVGAVEREKIAQLIWSRLDTPGAAAGLTGMSVPEASRTSDALTAQLRQRLQLDPSGSAVLVRLRDLRAQLERLRDQIALEPREGVEAARLKLQGLAARLEVASDKAGRGGDVGGLLGPLELDAATFERDLIVGGAMRRQNAARIVKIDAIRRRLAEREPGLRALVERTVAAVTPAPKYAVPDIENLGPVPTTTPELDAYEARLASVGKAMDVVEESYSAALESVEALRSELAGIEAKGLDATGASLLAAARGVLGQTPVQLDAARSLVAGCRAYASTSGGRS